MTKHRKHFSHLLQTDLFALAQESKAVVEGVPEMPYISPQKVQPMRISNSANHKSVLISARPTLFSVSEPPLDSLRKRHATL
jgi:hypothetical protein